MNKKVLFLIGLLSVALIIAGCSTAPKGPAFEPEMKASEDQGIVYISREKAMVGSMMAANIELNGKKSTALKQDGYIVILAPQGTLSVRVYAGLFNKTIPVNVKAGQSYLLRMEGTDIKLVDLNQAQYKEELSVKTLQERIIIP